MTELTTDSAAPAIPAHREVTRLVTYRGSIKEVAAQLARSLPDGPRVVRQGAVTITVRTLDDATGLNLGTALPLHGALRRITALEDELAAAWLALRDARNEVDVLRGAVPALTAPALTAPARGCAGERFRAENLAHELDLQRDRTQDQ